MACLSECVCVCVVRETDFIPPALQVYNYLILQKNFKLYLLRSFCYEIEVCVCLCVVQETDCLPPALKLSY